MPTKPWPRLEVSRETVFPVKHGVQLTPSEIPGSKPRWRKLLALLTLWAITTGLIATVKFNPDIPFSITLAVCSVGVALSIAVTAALAWAILTLLE